MNVQAENQTGVLVLPLTEVARDLLFSISADDLYFRTSKNKLESVVEGWILDHRHKRQKKPSFLTSANKVS